MASWIWLLRQLLRDAWSIWGGDGEAGIGREQGDQTGLGMGGLLESSEDLA